MNKSIIIEVKQDLKELLNDIRTKIDDSGGRFDGDVESGTFHLTGISGSYKTNSENKSIEITITSKPFFISMNRIEEELKKYFS